MSRHLLCLLLLNLLARISFADEALEFPGTSPPSIVLASATEKDGAIEIRLRVPRIVIEERIRVVEENGRRTETIYKAHSAVFKEETFAVDGEVKIYDRAGKPIDPKTLPKRLEKSTAVPLAFDRIADQKYLEAFRDDITVIVLTGEKAKAVMLLVSQ